VSKTLYRQCAIGIEISNGFGRLNVNRVFDFEWYFGSVACVVFSYPMYPSMLSVQVVVSETLTIPLTEETKYGYPGPEVANIFDRGLPSLQHIGAMSTIGYLTASPLGL